MTKRIINIFSVSALLLCLLCSFVIMPVYATDEIVVGDGEMYVENEDGSLSEYVPPETVSPDETGSAEYVERGEVLTKEEWYAQQGITTGGNGANSNTNSSGVSYDDVIIDETGTGTISVKFDLPENFYQNILVELYNRKTAEVIQVPVYASNEWTARKDVPAGYYMVYNVLAGGDDALDPDWVFELGTKVTVANGESINLDIKLLKGPNYEAETQPETTNPTGAVTDTEMNPNDTIPDSEIPEEPETLGQKALRILKGFVTGPNLVILIVLAGSGIAYWYIKKKKEDN